MKRLTSIFLVFVLLLSLASNAFAAGAQTPAADPIIDQVYGGGGKGDTPISNSFIELYNPSDEGIDLSAYSLQYGDKTLALDGVIPANGSYLVVGAAEDTTDEFLTCDLPDADKVCDWVIDNKSYTIELLKDATAVDSVTAGDSAATKISKQKSLKRVNHGDFALVVWEKGTANVDEAYVAANAPHNSKGACGKVHSAAQEPTYTPVQAGDVRVKGFFNADGTVQLELSGRYNSGAMNADGGSLEIVAYNPETGYAYAVSGVKGKLISVDLNGNTDGDTVKELTGTEYDIKALVSGFSYGDITSVSVSPDGKKLAVAIQAENYADKGVAALFSCAQDGSLTLLSTVRVGVQPDMVTFADNSTILTADEGEPREGVNGTDPKGSVSIVTIGENNALTANTVYFDGFNDKRDELAAKGVLIQKDTQPSTDFEPEYIAVSGNTAYVSLQEANAIAVLDIASGEFTGVYPLGFQDYGTTKVDLQKNDAIELENYPNVYGIKMPDGISVTEIGGKTYLLTANEGDSRADWAGLDNEYENATSPTGNVTLDKKVVWFNANMWDGLDSNKAYVFGGRSFSIYEATENGLELVYDSGSGFEEITAQKLPDYFNTSNDKTSIDNRSGKKGPEPESVVTGVIGNKTFAFIALERIGGIMVYDITDPANAKFANYINSREFDDVIQGDVSPEGLCFIPASSSKTGKALLLAACEVSGTLAVYECDYEQPIAKADYSKVDAAIAAVPKDLSIYTEATRNAVEAAVKAVVRDKDITEQAEVDAMAAAISHAVAALVLSGGGYIPPYIPPVDPTPTEPEKPTDPVTPVEPTDPNPEEEFIINKAEVVSTNDKTEEGKSAVYNVSATQDSVHITGPAAKLIAKSKTDTIINLAQQDGSTVKVTIPAESKLTSNFDIQITRSTEDGNGIVEVNIGKKATLPAAMKFTVNVTKIADVKAGDKVYIYTRAEDGTLTEIANNVKTVSKSGNVSLSLKNNCTLVFSSEKIEDAVKLVDTVSYKLSAKTVQKGKSVTLTAVLPNNIAKVASFTKNSDPVGKEEAIVTYKSSNTKIATVSKNGKITGKKAGTVKITMTVKLENGQQKTFTKTVTVK